MPGCSHRRHTGLAAALNDTARMVPFETELFSGQLCVWVRGLPTTPAGLFEGRKRQFWFVIQGMFKHPVPFDDLMVGTEFASRLRLPGSRVLTQMALWLVNRFGGAVTVKPAADQPYLLAPFVANAQLINVSRPGEQPPATAAQEDLRLLLPSLQLPDGSPWSADERRAHFRSPQRRRGLLFDTRYVYTFHGWENHINFATYKLNALLPLDMAKICDGQPIQLMIKDASADRYLMCLEVWHERLLRKAHKRATKLRRREH